MNFALKEFINRLVVSLLQKVIYPVFSCRSYVGHNIESFFVLRSKLSLDNFKNRVIDMQHYAACHAASAV